MESDWSVEIGAGLASIAIPWRGDGFGVGCGSEFIDLRAASDLSAAVRGIPEARAEPVLFHALVRLNGLGSPVSTSKCDVWPLKEDEIDPYEFDAASPALIGQASYIDLVFRDEASLISLERHQKFMRIITDSLRKKALRSARVDFVLRQAEVRGTEGFGITVYAMGCGRDGVSAATSWGAALEAAVEAICDPQVSDALD